MVDEISPVDSILISTKKVLGIAQNFIEFDLDIIIHINSAFAILNQLGIGPDDTFIIEDEASLWDDLELPQNQLSLVKSYIYMKTRMAFDPPTIGFLIDAINNMIKEQETRLSYLRETDIPDVIPTP